MPKNKVNPVVQIGQKNLTDAQTLGRQFGYTAKYMNQLARAGKIPWHGVRNGVKVYRRFDPEEVLAALAHGVEVYDGDDTRPAPVSHKRRSTGRPADNVAHDARARGAEAQ
jgi:hypothetical protein